MICGIFILAVALVLYVLFGEKLLSAMYTGQSADVLNAMMTGQALWPLEAYLKKYDKIFFCFIAPFLGLFAIFLIILKSAKKSFDMKNIKL